MDEQEKQQHHEEYAAYCRQQMEALRPVLSHVLVQAAEIAHKWFSHQGFDQSSKSEMIALEHSELSERLEAVRHNDEANEHEEAADALTRLLHYCGKYGINLGDQFVDKMMKNFERPYRHGKEF